MNEREHFLAWHRLHIKRRPLPYSSGACVKVRWARGAKNGGPGDQKRGTRALCFESDFMRTFPGNLDEAWPGNKSLNYFLSNLVNF